MSEGFEIYDNFFLPPTRDHIFNTVQNSKYTIGWNDSRELDKRAYPCLFSHYNLADLQNLKILDFLLKKTSKSKFKKHIISDNLDKVVVNLTKPHDVNFIHVHPNEIVFLYYVNATWNPEWGGETLLYKDNHSEILFSSPFTPNRVLIFDGEIPHTIKAQNFLGLYYRFTLSLFFKKSAMATNNK